MTWKLRAYSTSQADNCNGHYVGQIVSPFKDDFPEHCFLHPYRFMTQEILWKCCGQFRVGLPRDVSCPPIAPFRNLCGFKPVNLMTIPCWYVFLSRSSPEAETWNKTNTKAYHLGTARLRTPTHSLINVRLSEDSKPPSADASTLSFDKQFLAKLLTEHKPRNAIIIDLEWATCLSSWPWWEREYCAQKKRIIGVIGCTLWNLSAERKSGTTIGA